ncbi:MAG: hypothetical protein DRI90_02055 [Deltaproteobacteria bacterium]|nr:MAG: hypothetical protein DRI90_02055 [Deltaproteobacteria bacterium]
MTDAPFRHQAGLERRGGEQRVDDRQAGTAALGGSGELAPPFRDDLQRGKKPWPCLQLPGAPRDGSRA